MENQSIIVILGPTATGKTKLAVSLAKKWNAEIISADSRQVYKGMDIGTGKDLAEYDNINYHLIDIKNPADNYNVHQFQKDFLVTIEKIKKKNKNIILCGGTGLYIQSVLENYEYTSIPVDLELRLVLQNSSTEELIVEFEKYDSSFSAIAKTESKKRLIRAIEIGKYLTENNLKFTQQEKLDFTIFGINILVETRRNRITERLNYRLENGLINEVENLLKNGITADELIFYGLEYKFIVEYLQEKYEYANFKNRLESAIHQYAKRQMTYFRKMEKDRHTIHWINGLESLELQTSKVLNIFKSENL